MKIRTARRVFLNFRNAKFNKFAILTVLVIATTWGGYGLLRHFASAQNGDFADNVKTFMEMISKKDDGSEKTEFYSGEEIIMNSRVEVSSEGSAKNYPNAYFLLKIPKQYLKANPRVTATSAITSNSIIQDNDYFVYRGNYANLQAGSINSVNYIFNFKDTETPENYKPEITHEVYDENGVLLSKQSKVLNTLKHQSWVSAGLNIKDSIYVARYTDKEKTNIEPIYFNDKNIPIINNFYTNNGINGGLSSSIGRKQVESIVYKITLPEYISPSPESLAAGWAFDENTRIASFTRTQGNFGYNNGPNRRFEIRYSSNTPLSILNKQAEIKFDTKVNYTDGTSLEASKKQNFTPKVFDYVDKESLAKISKGSNVGGLGYRYNIKKIEGYSVSGWTTDMGDIDYANNKNFFWQIKLDVLNDGTNIPQPISYIKDELDNDDSYIHSVNYAGSSVGYLPFRELKISKVDVYAIDTQGNETKAGEMKLNDYKVELPYGTKGFRLQFPENTTLPTNLAKFTENSSFWFDVETRFFDVDKLRETLTKPNQEYWIKNNTVVNFGNGSQKEAKSINVFDRQRKEVNNRIQSQNRQPITNVGTHPRFEVTRSNRKIQKPVYFLLFSDELGIGDKAQECISQGNCVLTPNYKNSGKQLLKITNVDSLNYNQFRDFVSSLIKVAETTTNGEYSVDFITMWDANDQFRYSNGNDDLDFGEDGNTNSTNIARSTTKFTVLKPEQVGVKKYVRKHNLGNFENAVAKLDPADLIDYRISVINISDRPLSTSRVLEVLPKAGDKKIVENNQGVQEERGSQIPATLTGALTERTGFTIKYSTDEPGSNQTESWNKNFVGKDEISDWSKVRMIKIEQNQGFEIPAQTVENFDFTAQIDQNAADNTVANNSVAVTISASGNLVESDPVSAKVEYSATVEGIAFEDHNKNNVYDENIDTLLPNYTAELFKNGQNQPVQTVKTDSKGHYSFKTKDFETYRVKFTRDDAIETVQTGDNSNNKASHTAANSTDSTVETSPFTFTNNIKHFVRNIGVFRRRGSVEAKFVDQNGNDLQNKVIVKDNALLSENYTATKPAEITKDNLVYVFEKLKNGSAPENGTVKEETQTAIFQYKPKEGGKVEAKFIRTGDNREISPTETVKPAGIQVGTEYSATSKQEITHNGLKYVYSKVSANSAPQNGRVQAEAQTVIFEYSPKAGKPVIAVSKIAGSNETIKTETVSPDGTQVGAQYSSTPQAEIVHNGITYVFSEKTANSAPQHGGVSEQEQTIVYNYIPKKGGQVLAQFVDRNGQTIKNTKVVKATNTPVGTEYSDEPDSEITSDSGLVYTFEKVKSGSKTGRVEVNSKEIVYQYQPKLGKGVNVRFINGKDNSVLDSLKLHEDGKQIGLSFNYSHPNEITDSKGLVYAVEAKTKAVSGRISGEVQTFDLFYLLKEGGKVEAKFINQNGEEIKDVEEISKAKTQVGTPYASKAPQEITKDGLVYVFEKVKEDSAPEIGKVKAENQLITYKYLPKKGGAVIERFLDQNGNPIQNENILHKIGTQIGTPFESVGTEKIEINGRIYQLKRVEGKQKGAVEENEIVISYIFEDITKISAPNTGIVKNISLFIALIAGIILTFFTVKTLKTRKS